MMKRLSLKGLRISGQRGEQEPSSPDDVPGAEYELPQCQRENSPRHHGSPAQSRSPRKDKKGFFKTLRRKLTPSFRQKQERGCSGVVDDDSSSDTLDGYRGAKGRQGSRSPHRRAGSSAPPPIPQHDEFLPHPTKEEISKSTEESSSPNEDDKSQMADAEYGHASAPAASQLAVPVEGTPSHSSPVAGCLHLQRHSSGDSCPNTPPPLMTRSSQAHASSVPQSDHDSSGEPPKGWSITKELFRLSKYGWYWGPITRVEAEEKLSNQPDGAFLVRDSSDERYLLSLSFRSYGRTLHTRIEHCNGVFSFYAPETEGFPSIVALIEHSMTDSQTGVFCYSRARSQGSPSFPVRLTKPVSRFTQVRSLQYLCRFVIRQYTRLDHLQKLPLPSSIKEWLEENQY